MSLNPCFVFLIGNFINYLTCVGSIQSIWDIRIDSSQNYTTAKIFPNYMYKNSYVAAKIICASANPAATTEIQVTWILRQVSCMEEMYEPNSKQYLYLLELEDKARMTDLKQQSKKKMLVEVTSKTDNRSLITKTEMTDNATVNAQPRIPPIAFQVSQTKFYQCGRSNIIELQNEDTAPYRRINWPEGADEPDVKTIERDSSVVDKRAQRVVVSAWESGMYHFQLAVLPKYSDQQFRAEVVIEMHGSSGYLSAIDWPLLPFNGVMAFMYLILSTVWIMIWARSHRFTLRIHVAMGLVAVAGAMSATLTFVQNAAENTLTGGVVLIMWFARILSVLQLASLNMVLMIVSTGYGISVPNLPRSALFKMTAVCILQFLVGITWLICTDTTLLVQYSYPTFTKVTLWLKVAIFVIMTAWIMVSSIKTLKHLRQRRHAGLKIATFTIFMLTCILAFMSHLTVFGISLGWMQACRKNWQLQWIFNSVSQVEAFVLLIVLMILWRPVDTSQTYAFAPLGMEQVAGDTEDEEDSETEIFSKESDKIKLEEL